MAEVVVIGAGPAGCSAAYFLARQGVDVVLLDRADFPRDKVCGEALSPRSLAVLRQMGLAGLCERAHPVTGGLIIAPNGRSMVSEAEAPGVMLRRRELDAALLERAREAGARFVPRRPFVRLTRRPDALVVGTGPGESFPARAAVLATGSNAAALKAAGVLRPPAAASSFAARAYFEGATGPPDKIIHSLDRFLSPGYGWIFPMGDGTVNVGVALHRCTARRLDLRGSFEWFLRDSMAARRFLGAARQVSPMGCGALRSGLRGSRLAAERLLMVGDAAGAAIPSNGEGISGALATGRMAAEALLGALGTRDLSAAALGAYARGVRARYGRRMKRAGWIRRMLACPAAVNWLVACGREDGLAADRLCDVIEGTRSARLLLSPRRLLRLFGGADRAP